MMMDIHDYLIGNLTGVDSVTAIGLVINVASLTAFLLCFGACLVLLWRSQKRLSAADHDRDQIRNAIERLANGDFSDQNITLIDQDSNTIQEAYGRLVPLLQRRIEELEWAAQHDTLTNLLNVGSFKKACLDYLRIENDADELNGALLFFDINDFKQINDSLGHDAGDKFLIAVSDRILLATASLKPHSNEESPDFEPVVGRLGGDEFAIFIPGDTQRETIENFIARLKRLLGEPCHIGVHSLRCKMSVGIAFASDHRNAYDKLLAAADTAMYEAKSRGNDSHCYFDKGMRTQADKKLEREMELRSAIQNNEFELYFQPQLNLKTNIIDRVEALIRWHHPKLGLVMPDAFIPFAENMI